MIFLDIDGVLNCSRTTNPRNFPYIVDRRLLRRLKRLIVTTGAMVVLSSSWRVDPIGRMAANYWEIPYADVCPDLPGRSRRDEILKWLKGRDITRFVVIDDEDDDLDGLPLFQPSSETGLSPEIVRGVARYLAGRSDEDMRAGVMKRALQRIEALFEREKD